MINGKSLRNVEVDTLYDTSGLLLLPFNKKHAYVKRRLRMRPHYGEYLNLL